MSKILIITEEQFNELRDTIIQIKDRLNNLKSETQEDDYLTPKEVEKVFKIPTRTQQQYRIDRIIPFKQKGRKILYSRKELIEWLDGKSSK